MSCLAMVYIINKLTTIEIMTLALLAWRKSYLASLEDENPITVDDGVQSVSDDQHRARLELLADRLLNESVGPNIHGRGRLVQN